MISRPSDQFLVETVSAAAGGDAGAGGALVGQYSGLVSFVVSDFQLSSTQQADVVAETWLRLVEHIAKLRDPARVGSWLATTGPPGGVGGARDTPTVAPGGGGA